jgi:hypothetical protein
MLASARSIVRSRSATCGAACQLDPCTLRQIRYAERALDEDPVLVVWAELSVVAHLIGEPMPIPTSEQLDALARFDPRHRECTLSHAVDAAVAVRTPAFARQLSPDALAVHVNQAMNACVIGTEIADDSCDWRDWQIAFGPRESDRRLVILGTDRPSRLEKAVGCSAGDPAWPTRIDRRLTAFVPYQWPIAQFQGLES